MKKIAVLCKEGFEEIEALTPVDILRRAGAVSYTHLDVYKRQGKNIVYNYFLICFC